MSDLAGQLKAVLGTDALEASTVEGSGILDLGRMNRRGFSEAIFCQGKTVEQVLALAARLAEAGQTVLCTRCTAEQLDALGGQFPEGRVDRLGRVFYHHSPSPSASEAAIAAILGAPVVVACAGTADLPVAQEAVHCLEAWRIPAVLVQDIGVAGLQRLIAAIPRLRRAPVIIAVAGMEATLPTAVAGLVECPVIGVPTSVGYGAHFQGLASLLSMLNSCAGGLTVVNIDNGFGGAMAAAVILHQSARLRQAATNAHASRGNHP